MSTRHSCTTCAVSTGSEHQSNFPSPSTWKVTGVGIFPTPGCSPGAPAESLSEMDATKVAAVFPSLYLAAAQLLEIGYIEIPFGDSFALTRILSLGGLPALYPNCPFFANLPSATFTPNSCMSERYLGPVAGGLAGELTTPKRCIESCGVAGRNDRGAG